MFVSIEDMDEIWDCIVVGGGAAGLSAALVLGRARRRTLVVDAGRPSNLVAPGIGGLLGHDGRPPAELYAAGRAELEAYPSVEVVDGEVVSAHRRDDDFVLVLADGASHVARRVLLAGGMDYRYPDVDGIAERWGRSVFHCPFCHGWEHRDRPLGVLDGSADAVHRGLLLRAWSDHVTVYTDGPSALGDDECEQLSRARVEIDDRRVAGLRGPGSTLDAVVLADGTERACGGLLVPAVLHQRSSLATQLGAEIAPPSPIAADAIVVDPFGQTTVPGLFAAGDTVPSMPSVANAIASGSTTAAGGVVRSLMTEVRP